MECVICLEDIKNDELVALKCAHMFHIDCVIMLIQKRTRKCPICRERITYIKKQLVKHKKLSRHIK